MVAILIALVEQNEFKKKDYSTFLRMDHYNCLIMLLNKNTCPGIQKFYLNK